MTIKNADMPAMPIMELNPTGAPVDYHAGLTKLERMAMAAMQGLLAGGYCINEPAINDVSDEALSIALGLLDRLEKVND
jgi:hypothetical protein